MIGRVGVMVAALAIAFPAVAASLSLGGPVSLPSVGLRFRVFRDMKPMPLPMPAIRAERRDDGAKLLLNREYWLFHQTAGLWYNENCAIQVGTVLYPPLAGPEFKTEGELAAALKKPEQPLSAERLKTWVQDFTQTGVKAVKPFPQSLYGCRATVYELEETAGEERIAYLLMPNNDPSRQVLFYFRIGKEQAGERADRVIRQALGSVQFLKPRVERVSLAESRRKKGTPEFEASRNRVIQSIRNLDDWWYVDTENYIFVSNQTDRRAMTRLRTELEHAREVFEACFPLRKPMQSVSVVRIFNKREEYLEYVGGEMQWSGGLWSPARRELVISPLDRRVRDSMQKMIMRQVAFHEGFHQYLFFATGEAQADMWYNEGTAQFFEGIEFRTGQGGVSLPQQSEKALVALFEKDRIHDVSALVKMDRAAFYGDNREVNYLLAQALVYYLWKGAPVADRPEYAEIPLRYYDKLVETKDPAAANAAAWEGVDMAVLAKELSRFWNDSNLIRESIRYRIPSPRTAGTGIAGKR